MKKFYAILCIAIASLTQLQAQAPQGFNYQATVRNSAGDLIINTNVYFKFNVIQGSQTAVPIFTETHYVPTDDLGQVSLVIGEGTATTGAFSSIDWSLGSYYLCIELDTGNGYVAMGTTQLLSVPYALYAESSGSSSSGFPSGGTEGQVLSIVSGVPTWTDLSGSTYSENLAEITTVEASDIDFESMTAGGNINDDGGFTIVSKGVVWSESPDPTPELETKTDEGGGASSFTSIITGLDEETEYFYRAYAITSAGTAYGSTYSFTTDSSQFYDQDGDGYTPEQGDCNDFDEFTHPGAAHNESTTACMTDLDGDGYGDIAGIDPGTDCNDSDDSINPGATELEDGVDNNCDGAVDYCPIQADFTGSYTLTFNGGGIAAAGNAPVWGDGTVVEIAQGSSNSERIFTVLCYPSFGFVQPETDYSFELVCGIASLNGEINNTVTGVSCDGLNSISLQSVSSTGTFDAQDDSTFTLIFNEDVGGVSCGAEGITSYTFTKNADQNDVDNDGDGFTENQGDCNDNNYQVNPGATEIEDGVDNDCDGEIDEGFNQSGTVTDIDGNTYDYLSYGDQVWTVENAEMVTYRDGTQIPQVTDATEWQNLTTGAWSYYNNDPTKPRLYNWYAVMGIHDTDPNTPNKEFAPEGWHVPSDAEWTTLEEYLIANGYNYDGTTTGNKIGKAMASTTGWYSSTSTGAVGNDQSLNNSSGFNVFPEGIRSIDGMFLSEGTDAFFWSSTEGSTGYAWSRALNNSFSEFTRLNFLKRFGFSVRFVRD